VNTGRPDAACRSAACCCCCCCCCWCPEGGCGMPTTIARYSLLTVRSLQIIQKDTHSMWFRLCPQQPQHMQLVCLHF
jgi:hypothetical protein